MLKLVEETDNGLRRLTFVSRAMLVLSGIVMLCVGLLLSWRCIVIDHDRGTVSIARTAHAPLPLFIGSNRYYHFGAYLTEDGRWVEAERISCYGVKCVGF